MTVMKAGSPNDRLIIPLVVVCVVVVVKLAMLVCVVDSVLVDTTRDGIVIVVDARKVLTEVDVEVVEVNSVEVENMIVVPLRVTVVLNVCVNVTFVVVKNEDTETETCPNVEGTAPVA